MINNVLSEENKINDFHVILSKIGFINKQNETKKFRLFRYFVIIAPLIFSIKCLISILIYYYKSNEIDKFERLLISLNDFMYYFPKLRIHGNFLLIIWSFGHVSAVQLTYYYLLHSNDGQQFHWMKPFEMLSGKIKPSEIEFTHWNDVMMLVKRLIIQLLTHHFIN